MLIIFKNKLKKYHTSVDDKIIFKLIFQVFCIGYLIQTLLLHIDNNISKLDCNLTLQKKLNNIQVLKTILCSRIHNISLLNLSMYRIHRNANGLKFFLPTNAKHKIIFKLIF